MKIPYDLIRYECENGTLEIRRYDDAAGYWHILGIFSPDAYENSLTCGIARSPNHPFPASPGFEFESIITLAKAVDKEKFLDVSIEIVKAISKLDVRHENQKSS